MHLSSLTWFDWAALATGWILIAVAMGPVIGRSIKQAEPADDRTWLDDQPRELVGAELDGQFYSLIARNWYI